MNVVLKKHVNSTDVGHKVPWNPIIGGYLSYTVTLFHITATVIHPHKFSEEKIL